MVTGTILVSVVIPCLNERSTIAQVLADLSAQDFSESFEVVLADGGSTDGTTDFIHSLVADGSFSFPLRILENPKRIIPAGLNCAVAAAVGEIIVRVDGHSRLPNDYLAAMVAALRAGPYQVVGPRILLIPAGPGFVAGAIVALLASPFGTGGTASRSQLTSPRRVAHAVMSCYRREVWQKLGGYDEQLASNEDFDFDYRAGLSGFYIAALPEPEFRLVARASLAALARQRWRYGWWKAAVLKKYPRSLHLRQAVPVIALLLALVGVPVLCLKPNGLIFLVVFFGVYLLVCVAMALMAWRSAPKYGGLASWIRSIKQGLATVVLAPVIFPIIHGVWAAGVLVGIPCNRRQSNGGLTNVVN